MNHNNDAMQLPEVLDSEVLYRGRKVDLVKLTIRPPGREPTIREVVRHPGAVVILPLTDAGQVVFVRNVRVAVGATLLELPAGTLDAGEAPPDCAIRELAEETGFQARTLRPICEFFTSPGVLSEQMFAFVATDLTAGPQRLDAGEQIEIETVDYDQAIAMCLDGRVRDGKSIATLLSYHLRERLREATQ